MCDVKDHELVDRLKNCKTWDDLEGPKGFGSDFPVDYPKRISLLLRAMGGLGVSYCGDPSPEVQYNTVAESFFTGFWKAGSCVRVENE